MTQLIILFTCAQKPPPNAAPRVSNGPSVAAQPQLASRSSEPVSEIEPDEPASVLPHPQHPDLQHLKASLLPGSGGGPADLQAAMQSTLQALAGGQHGELVQHYAARFGVSTEELQQRMQELHSRVQGAENGDLQMPTEALQQMTLQWAQGAMPPGGPAAMGPEGDMLHAAAMANGAAEAMLETEEQQTWLDLYSRAYAARCDFVYPPLFIVVTAGAFWASLLPFLLAVFLVPFLFVSCTHLILGKGAGMPVKLLPFSNYPFAWVIAVEVAAVASVPLVMLPWLRGSFLTLLLFALFATVAICLHYRVYMANPGVIPPEGPPQPMHPMQRLAMQASNPAWCFTCNIYRPIRSKHCAICDKCISEFDHHCPIVGNCVGMGNRREYLGYLVTLFIAELFWFALALRFFGRVLLTDVLHSHASELPSAWAIVRHTFALGKVYPGSAYLALLMVPITLGTAALAGRQAFCVLANLTTNELLGRDKYGYLHAQDGTFSNPFDKGPLTNCAQFWSNGRPDWYSAYAAAHQQQAHDEEQQEQGDGGGSSSERAVLVGGRSSSSSNGGGGDARPWLSASRLLTRWDRTKAKLQESRLQRRRRREEQLLREYGGVSEEALQQGTTGRYMGPTLAAGKSFAAYDKESQFFDLNDLENTLGSWDMYGQDQEKQRYNGLQSEFFNRAAGSLNRREYLLGLVALGGVGILVWGGKGSKDIKLPITVGPQKGGEPGPRGRI
ncbi:hypothetical protein N2152v2_008028 [Parachlorella kessleri]